MVKFSEESNYLMPAHFGGYPGRPPAATYHDVTAINVSYETDPGMLAEFLPESFELAQPVLTIQYARCRRVDWMGGGGYNLITVAVPAAHVHGRQRLEGVYVLVIWENRTEPILRGREQSGMPKIFADIEDPHQLGDRVLTNASFEGWTLLRLDFQQSQRLSPDECRLLNERAGVVNAFGWRYIPNIGRPGAALSHATLFPQEFVYTTAWQGEGRVRWEALGPEQCPLYAPIVQPLSRLPIKAYRDGLMTQGSLVLRNDIARQLP